MTENDEFLIELSFVEFCLNNNWTIIDKILSAFRDPISELIDNALMVVSEEYPFIWLLLKPNFDSIFIYFEGENVFLLAVDDRTVTRGFIDFQGLGDKIISKGIGIISHEINIISFVLIWIKKEP